MTVKELIEELKAYPPDAEVMNPWVKALIMTLQT